MMEDLDQQHEEYRQGYGDAADWIRCIRLDIQQSGDFNGERNVVEEKQRKCCQLRQTFPAGEQLVDKAVKLSKVVINDSRGTRSKRAKTSLPSCATNGNRLCLYRTRYSSPCPTVVRPCLNSRTSSRD